MKYRIKNPEIEKAILGLRTTDNIFVETINRYCEQFEREMLQHTEFIVIPNGFSCSVCIDKNDIKLLKERIAKAEKNNEAE